MSQLVKSSGRPRKAEADKASVWLSAIRVTAAVRDKVIAKAQAAGYGRKLSEYRLKCYLGLTPDDKPGMSIEDVTKNLADLNRMAHAKTEADFWRHWGEVRDRHLAVIKQGL